MGSFQQTDSPWGEMPPQDRVHDYGVVLNSWKEIAAYLHCGVRTAQRWEHLYQLPVRRPRGTRRGHALAFSSELDNWLRRQPLRSDTATTDGQEIPGNALSVASSKSSDGAAQLVLSVDDKPAVSVTREAILQNAGYAVRRAGSGRAAIEIFAECPIDVVLLDCAVPDVNGRSVAQNMKERKPWVPIIMIAADPLAKKNATAADGSVKEGQDPSVLLKTIRRVLATVNSKQQITASRENKPPGRFLRPRAELGDGATPARAMRRDGNR